MSVVCNFMGQIIGGRLWGWIEKNWAFESCTGGILIVDTMNVDLFACSLLGRMFVSLWCSRELGRYSVVIEALFC